MKEKVIRLAHGAGGRIMADLIRDVFTTPLDNPYLRQMADSAVVQSTTRNPQFAISTDSFVVRPLFFPGGDIGSLAIHGTVNDVAMRAHPLGQEVARIGVVTEAGLFSSHTKRSSPRPGGGPCNGMTFLGKVFAPKTPPGRGLRALEN